MSATAIIQVTRAFRDRLTAALTKSGIAGTVFVGPLDDADASGAALILFLYRVVPNPVYEIANISWRTHRLRCQLCFGIRYRSIFITS